MTRQLCTAEPTGQPRTGSQDSAHRTTPGPVRRVSCWWRTNEFKPEVAAGAPRALGLRVELVPDGAVEALGAQAIDVVR